MGESCVNSKIAGFGFLGTYGGSGLPEASINIPKKMETLEQAERSGRWRAKSRTAAGGRSAARLAAGAGPDGAQRL